MKNSILLLLFLFGLNTSLKATHNRAGEITFKQLSTLTFEITVTTYTKASSSQADRDSLNVYFGDGSYEWVSRNNGLNNNGVIVGNDIKKNTYVTTHNYPSAGNYLITMTDPNRNGGILNVYYPYSDQMPFHIETQLIILTSGTNQSPILMQPPIDLGCTNNIFKHNPVAFDPDGDSLVFQLRVPLQGPGTVVTNFQWPNNVGGGGQTLTLDAATGQMEWDAPLQAGEYNIAFSIKEYRNGQMISKTIRDMQITISSCSNRAPIITTPSNTITMQAKDTLSFPITVTDLDGDMVNLSALGGPMLSDGSFVQPAQVTITDNGTNTPTATLIWETNCDHRQYQPYLIVFRAEDDFNLNNSPNYGVDYAVMKVIITNNTALPCPPLADVEQIDKQVQKLKVFPNPATEWLNVELELKLKSKVTIQVINLVGQVRLIKHFDDYKINDQLDISSLEKGIYFVNIRIGNEMMTRKIIVE